jgi:hypothetical protein
MMRSARRLVIVLAALLLAACGGPDENSPEGVVKRLFDRVEDQEESGVRDLLCQDYRQNVNFDLGEDQDVKLRLDFKYRAAEDGDDREDTHRVAVYGKSVVILDTDHVRSETKQIRDEDAAWEINVFRVDGNWRVCGGDPALLALLDLAGLADALE